MLLIGIPLIWFTLATLSVALCRIAAYGDLEAGVRGSFA
jgi:hypothetical protein